MKNILVITVVASVILPFGCTRGGITNYPDPVSVQIFIHVMDDVTLEPLSEAKVYYEYRVPRRIRPIPLWEEAPTAVGVVTTDALGGAVIDLDRTISVRLGDAVLPGYLWVKEGATYSERRGGWTGGRSLSRGYLVRDHSIWGNPVGLSPDKPFVYLMKKGAKERVKSYWRQFDERDEG